MSLTLKVPSIGESIREATIGVWKKAEGDWVDLDEPLVEVESEKATLEIPSPGAGVLKKILHPSGDTVAIGDAIAEIDETARPAAKGVAVAVVSAPASPATTAKNGGGDGGGGGGAGGSGGGSDAPAPLRAPPSARKRMTEAGLSAEEVKGTGRGGRIQARDVERTLEERNNGGGGSSSSGGAAAPAAPPAAIALREALPAGARERVEPMTTIRKTIARKLVEAQHNAAILTTFNEIDMSSVLGLRERHQERFVKRHGVKLGFMSFFVKAAIEALKAFPAVNAEVRGTDIVYKDHYDIGVAVGGGRGLVVPVVRDADGLSFAEVEKTIGELAARAKDNKLQLAELQGGTFTISNGGIYGSMMSTPILNPPQSGILGLHATQKRAVVIDDQIVIRPMMYVALSYDHRIVDGREAVQFLVRIKECIESPERILIEI